jgi:drug/metabolite transporter (DMT)-like permease
VKARAELALLFDTLIWGSTFVVVKRGLEDISPLLFLFCRFTLATLAMLILLRGKWNAGLRSRVALKAGLIAGLALFAGFLFQTLGLRLTTATKSAFLTGLSIPMVPLLGAAVYQTRPRLPEVGGVLLATGGMLLLVWPGNLEAVNTGDLLTLAGAAAFAVHIIAVSHFSRKVGFRILSLLQVAAMAVFAGLTFWSAETPNLRLTEELLLAIGITALLGTALAYTLQTWAQQHTTATRAAIIFAMEPVFAWLTSYAVAGETFSGRALSGALLILCGIILVELKPMENQQHP